MIMRLAPLLALAVLCSCTTADRSREDTTSVAAKDDLKLLQGRWECPLGDTDARGVTRAVKVVNGSSETVTYVDKAGKTVYATAADIKLETKGKVSVFTYWNWRVTQGAEKVSAPADGKPRSYIYRLDGDHVHEAHGLMTDSPAGARPRVYMWTRMQ